MSAVADEKATIDFHTGVAQRANFFEKRHGIEDHAIADYAAATCPQNAARHQLQDKLLALDDDGMAGVMAAGIARHDGEVFREHVDNLAFALVAPLGADDDRSFSLLQMLAPWNRMPRPSRPQLRGRTHSLPR
jgi:hypothetical protein